MRRRAAACAALLLLCGCAATKPAAWEPSITAVRATFRSHLSVVRSCESRGVAPTLEAAKAAGANLALVFASPMPAASDKVNPQALREEATWIPLEAKPAAIAGVRAFKCPDVFLDNIVVEMKRPREAAK